MKSSYVRSAALSFLLTTLATTVDARPVDSPRNVGSFVDPSDYPRMTDKEIGHVRHMARLSRNLYGDWTGYGTAFTPLQREQMFVISFMSYALVLAQHELTPAYREIYQSSIENFLKKLEHPDIWERWMFESRGGSVNRFKDGQTDWMKDPGWIDPVLKDNIQLKAYMLQIAASYQMLYGDKRYEQPGAFTFRWRGGQSNGKMTFRYTLTDLAKNIYQEVADSEFLGSACEPGRVFWICNAPSNAGFIIYDHLYGTNYRDAGPKMSAKWIEKGYRDPKNYTNAVWIRTGIQDPSRYQEAATALLPLAYGEEGGWGAVYNNAWDPEWTRAQYLAQRDHELDQILTGKKFQLPKKASLRHDVDASMDQQEILDGMAFKSFTMGFFFNYAAEMGDQESKDKLFAYAERNFNPVWQNGEYYYPRNDDYSVDAQGNMHGVDVWAGSALIPMARFNKGDGLRKIYTEQWGAAQHQQPYISDVDTLTAGVSQAFYDAKKSALIVTLLPGPIAAKETSFVVRQLDSDKRYSLVKDGRTVGTLDRSGTKTLPAATWREDGALLLTTQIAGPHTFVLQSAK